LIILYFLVSRNTISLKSPKLKLIVLLSLVLIYFASSELIKRVKIEQESDFIEVLDCDKFNRIYPWTGSTLRLLQSRILYEQIQEEGIFWKGFGLFASRDYLRERHVRFNTYKGYHKYNYHNQYAQITAELGVIGLILLVLLLLLSFRRAIIGRNFVFLSFCVIITILFVTESFLWVHRGVFFFSIFYCLFHKKELET
jgi:hypothetical protein